VENVESQSVDKKSALMCGEKVILQPSPFQKQKSIHAPIKKNFDNENDHQDI